jgi:sugar phosphate isomerase/epimerase
MKFAFSTVACPAWDFETVVARAREYGYDGVELRAGLNDSILTASNPFLTDPKKVRDLFAGAGLGVCCLASSIEMTQNRRADVRQIEDLRRYVDVARELDCPLVRVFDMKVKPGWDRSSAGVAFGDWLLPAGDYAAERGVTIVVENALSFRSAKEMWAILDRLGHPSIACCWDVFNAALIGEAPAFSVPTLNSRIQYAQVKDAKLGSLGATYCKLGDGDVPVEKFLIRLRGIGYGGWVTFEWEKAWLPNLAEPEEVLPDAIKKLRTWAGIKSDNGQAEADSEPAAPAKRPAKAAAH